MSRKLLIMISIILIFSGCFGNKSKGKNGNENQLPGTISKEQLKAFPGAEGFGANATGGRGGDVVYVTNLNPEGPGSLNYALGYHGNTEMRKPRYILFKVSGIVTPGAYLWDHKTHIEYGDFTLAGHTAKGGIITAGIMTWDQQKTYSQNNFIIRHLRSRPGNIKNGLDDAARFEGAQNFIIDHCSFEWASDEAMQIAKNKNITIQNTIFGETLGEHYDRGGILIKYSTPERPNTDISFHHNMFNRIGGRLPQGTPHIDEEGRGMRIEISNNLIWDPGSTKGIIKSIYFTNWLNEANKYMDWWFNLNLVNNYSFSLPVEKVTKEWANCADVTLNHDNTTLYMKGNGINIYPEEENKVKILNLKGKLMTERNNFPKITYTETKNIPEYIIKKAGAFPRDAMDRRLIKSVAERIINTVPCNEKGADDGYTFDWEVMPIPELDSDDDGMPDWWELHNGLNPLAKDHNGKGLSKLYTGAEGYDNIEVYLNRLSDYYIDGKVLTEGTGKQYGALIEQFAVTTPNIVPGEQIDFTIKLKKQNIKTVELSLALLTAPFAAPAPKPIDITEYLSADTVTYSYMVPADRTKGEYSIMLHIESSEGIHDYKIIKLNI